MSFLGRLFGRLFRAETGSVSDLTNPRKWLLDWAGWRKTQSGENVNPQSVLALSSYYACMRCIAEDVSKLPLITYRRMARGKERQRSHPTYKVLHDQANEDMTATEARMLLQFWACGWGNGVAEIGRDDLGFARALYPIHPSRVEIRRSKSNPNRRVYLIHNDKAGVVEMPAEDVLHIRGAGNEDGGYSIFNIAAESLGLSISAQTFGASFFGNGSTLSGILKHPATLGEDAAKNLRKSWVEMHGGPYNAGRPAILEEGMTYERIGIPPEDAQFLETRQFQVEEVCRWFRMPPHKIQHLLRATFSNIEHQGIEYVTDTLQPWFTRWEQEIQRKLFPGEPEIFAEHLAAGLLRGDNAARVAFYNGMFMIGGMSQNDIREAENMNGIGPDGDVYYIPANMVRSEDAAKGLPQYQKKSEPEESPDGNPPQDMPGVDRIGDPEESEDGNDPEESDALNTLGACSACESATVYAHEKVISAMRPVLEASAAAVLRKEERAATRAAEKVAGNASGFSDWLADFYAEHANYVSDAVQPAGMALAFLMGGQELVDRQSCTWGRISLEHCVESQKELCRLFVLGRVAEEFPKFAAERAKALAASVISEVTNGS